MKETILLVLGFVLVNNYALSAGLGLTPLLGFSRKGEKMLTLGLAVTVVTVLSSLILWLLRETIPGYWLILAAVTVILVLVYLLQLICGKKLGVWFPVIALNSAVLGAALKLQAAETLGSVLLSSLGIGLGFLFGLFLLTGVQEKLEHDQAPKAFRGFPLQILAAAIVALALTAFQFK